MTGGRRKNLKIKYKRFSTGLTCTVEFAARTVFLDKLGTCYSSSVPRTLVVWGGHESISREQSREAGEGKLWFKE